MLVATDQLRRKDGAVGTGHEKRAGVRTRQRREVGGVGHQTLFLDTMRRDVDSSIREQATYTSGVRVIEGDSADRHRGGAENHHAGSVMR